MRLTGSDGELKGRTGNRSGRLPVFRRISLTPAYRPPGCRRPGAPVRIRELHPHAARSGRAPSRNPGLLTHDERSCNRAAAQSPTTDDGDLLIARNPAANRRIGCINYRDALTWHFARTCDNTALCQESWNPGTTRNPGCASPRRSPNPTRPISCRRPRGRPTTRRAPIPTAPLTLARVGEGALTDLSRCVTATRRLWPGSALAFGRRQPLRLSQRNLPRAARRDRNRARPRPWAILLRSSTMARVATWLHQTMPRRRVARCSRTAELGSKVAPVGRYRTRALLTLAEIQSQSPRRFM
jgi:hypothetical protein